MKKTKDFVFVGKCGRLTRLLKQIRDHFGKQARLGDVLKAIEINR